MSELKPCPFCGSSNTALDYYEISCPQELGTIVVCNDCGASATSIVDWNTRPIEDALNARIAELEYQLEDWAEDYKARIAELEEEVTKGNELQDSYCDRIAKLEAYVAELEEEVTKGNELQDSYCDRIAKLEAYVAELEEEAEVQE